MEIMDYEKIIKQMIADEAISKEVVEKYCPELTESDDERIRKEIISNFNETIDNIRSEEIIPRESKVLIGKIRKWIAWLEKQGEQKPTEWSEEDEEKINEIIDYLDYKGHKTDVEFLKSLKPQNRWKPSNEEMDALASALSLANNCGEESAFDLRTLYEQLKKLREE